ncbi:HlyD family efflux transporter periplasmic adaptor subunit [Actinacidiphila alni]|uniref:HlyD family efflux transporter periplasmic adaptor subunit n=1 Tax=Actinacidiphila alni TaxID=380248 RepID=UPI00340262E3
MTTTVEPGARTASGTERTAGPAPLPTAAVEPGLDRPVRLIGGRLWLALAALVLLIGAGTAWGVAGALPHTMTLHGVLAHGAAPVVARADAPGSVQRVLVAPGSRVTKGQTLAVLAGDGPPTDLTAPVDGTVTAVLTAPGGPTVAGTGVIALDPSGGPATVRLFVADTGQLGRLELGQSVQLPLRNGTVTLRITSVAPYPSRADTLSGTLPVPVPGVPADGATPVWTVYAQPVGHSAELTAAAQVPTAVDAVVDLGARHPYQVLLDATGAGR